MLHLIRIVREIRTFILDSHVTAMFHCPIDPGGRRRRKTLYREPAMEHFDRSNNQPPLFPDPFFFQEFPSSDGNGASFWPEEVAGEPHSTMMPRRPSAAARELFFKTKLCERYKLTGSCHYGNRCCYAHGRLELRSGQSDRQDILAAEDDRTGVNRDQRICRMFSSSGSCLYGESCKYQHIMPRSSSSPDDLPPRSGNGGDRSRGYEAKVAPAVANGDPNESAARPYFWKTKMCLQWEATGNCPYGEKCSFAHGVSELSTNGRGGHADSGSRAVHGDVQLPQGSSAPVVIGAGQLRRREGAATTLTAKRKLNGIYGDWLLD